MSSASPSCSPARVRRSRAGLSVLFAGLLTLVACGDSTAGPSQLVDEGEQPTGSDEATTDAGATEDGGEPASGDDAEDASATTAPSATGTVWSDVDYSLVNVATLAQPISLTSRPGDDDLWVLERAGRVRLIERSIDEAAGTETLTLDPDPVLDLSSDVTTEGEGGLLGIAFAPDGSELYLHYTRRDGTSVISAFAMDGAAPGEERVLLTVAQPFSNHNGGDLDVDADGLLYISLGDGGGGGDPENNGQDPTTLLGSILRIDPAESDGSPYGIPADNPFADATDGTRPEIWVWGLRNPWRISFDRDTGELWTGDVGQELIEEVNLIQVDDGGANLGWNLMEGNQSYGGDAPADHLPPIHTYDHDQGRCSVTGGYVYRGPVLPALDGIYLFADYCAPGIAGVERTRSGDVAVAELSLDRRPEQIIAFGQDADGEVYVLEAAGAVSRIQTPDWPWDVVTG